MTITITTVKHHKGRAKFPYKEQLDAQSRLHGRCRASTRGGEVQGTAARNKEPSGNRHNTGLRRAIPSQIRAATGQVPSPFVNHNDTTVPTH